MTPPMPERTAHGFAGADGVSLSYRELGAGRPVVLLHGYLITAQGAWVRPGIAAALAADGRRAIMPDLRGHGAGPWSHDPADYPSDALTDDGLALVEQLGLVDYDLVGYSVGGRVVARMLTRGARPRRAIVAGTGLEPIVRAAGRGEGYRKTLGEIIAEDREVDGARQAGLRGRADAGRREANEGEGTDWDLATYLRAVGADPVALSLVLDTLVDTPLGELEAIDTPTLVLAGVEEDRGSIQELAAAIPGAAARRIPGNHWSASQAPEFTAAILEFLRD